MTHYIIPAHVLHQTIDGEVILINLWNGTYHSLRGAGALLLPVLVAGTTADELQAWLAAATDGEPATVAADVERLLGSMRRLQLVVEAPSTAAAPPPPAQRRAWQDTRFETFTDLTDLLGADPVHDADAAGWPNVAPDARER
jgi:hypothetical protein